MLKCTAPRSPAHVESYKKLLQKAWCVWFQDRERFRGTEEWNIVLKPIEGKRIVFCAALREKMKKVIFLLLKTHKANKLGVFSRTII